MTVVQHLLTEQRRMNTPDHLLIRIREAGSIHQETLLTYGDYLLLLLLWMQNTTFEIKQFTI